MTTNIRYFDFGNVGITYYFISVLIPYHTDEEQRSKSYTFYDPGMGPYLLHTPLAEEMKDDAEQFLLTLFPFAHTPLLTLRHPSLYILCVHTSDM